MTDSLMELDSDFDPTSTMTTTEDRKIKAVLAPRMKCLLKLDKLSDVVIVLRDTSKTLLAFLKKCNMTHGDVAPANLLYYYPHGEGEVFGVLNDFDGMVFDGRHLEGFGVELDKIKSSEAAADSDVVMSHEEVVASLG